MYLERPQKVCKKREEELKISGRIETTQKHSIVMIGEDTQKSLGDLRKLAVAKIPVTEHQLKLM